MSREQDKEEALLELEDELMDDLREIVAQWAERAGEIEGLEIGLEKNDIHMDELALFWVPR